MKGWTGGTQGFPGTCDINATLDPNTTPTTGTPEDPHQAAHKAATEAAAAAHQAAAGAAKDAAQAAHQAASAAAAAAAANGQVPFLFDNYRKTRTSGSPRVLLFPPKIPLELKGCCPYPSNHVNTTSSRSFKVAI